VSSLLSLPLALALSAVLPGDADRKPIEPALLRPGMTSAEVLERLGPPKKTARQLLYKRCLEQWIYEAPHFLRIEFDCVQGRRAQVLTIQPFPSPRP
jgi:hypothetical protein